MPKYLPVYTLNQSTAVILEVSPRAVYPQFYVVGQSIRQYLASCRRAGLSGYQARAYLREDWQHGNITLGQPE